MYHCDKLYPYIYQYYNNILEYYSIKLTGGKWTVQTSFDRFKLRRKRESCTAVLER